MLNTRGSLNQIFRIYLLIQYQGQCSSISSYTVDVQHAATVMYVCFSAVLICRDNQHESWQTVREAVAWHKDLRGSFKHLPALKLAVKSHGWGAVGLLKTRHPWGPCWACLLLWFLFMLCNMYSVYSQPITEGPAALHPHLHGNLTSLPPSLPPHLERVSYTALLWLICRHYEMQKKINLIGLEVPSHWDVT